MSSWHELTSDPEVGVRVQAQSLQWSRLLYTCSEYQVWNWYKLTFSVNHSHLHCGDLLKYAGVEGHVQVERDAVQPLQAEY